MAEVTVTDVQSLSAGLAMVLLVRHAHASVHSSMSREGSARACGDSVVYISIGYLKDSLVDDVLGGSGSASSDEDFSRICALSPYKTPN